MTCEELVAEAGAALRANGIHNGAQEARWLLCHVMSGDSPSVAGSSPGGHFSMTREQTYRGLLQRRLSGEPLQYILRSAEFYGLDFEVGPGVLIPRPETERLVDFALSFCPPAARLCDLCTGSGAVLLAMMHELGGDACGLGVDISAAALDYAVRNAARLGVSHARFLQGDLLTAVSPACRFDLITANPPYVSPAAYEDLPEEVSCHEPRLALWAADEGLAVVRRIADSAFGRLSPGGVLLCEISSEQGPACHEILRAAGYVAIEIRRDYCDRDRIAVARRGD